MERISFSQAEFKSNRPYLKGPYNSLYLFKSLYNYTVSSTRNPIALYVKEWKPADPDYY